MTNLKNTIAFALICFILQASLTSHVYCVDDHERGGERLFGRKTAFCLTVVGGLALSYIGIKMMDGLFNPHRHPHAFCIDLTTNFLESNPVVEFNALVNWDSQFCTTPTRFIQNIYVQPHAYGWIECHANLLIRYFCNNTAMVETEHLSLKRRLH